MQARVKLFAGSKGCVTAIASWRAGTDETKAALPPGDVSRVVAWLERDAPPEVVSALYDLANGTELRLPERPKMAVSLQCVERAIEARAILLVPGWDLHGGSPQTGTLADHADTPEEWLLRQILGKDGAITVDGARYSFLPARRWSTTPPDEKSRIVPLIEARRIVTTMAQRFAGAVPAQRRAWDEVSRILRDNLQTGEGLLLLRGESGSFSAATPPTAERSDRPSPFRAVVAERGSLKIVVHYDDGTPYLGRVIVTPPGRPTTEGPPGPDGVIEFEGLEPGTGRVSFPDVDARDIEYRG
jgi:hypothetical protein